MFQTVLPTTGFLGTVKKNSVSYPAEEFLDSDGSGNVVQRPSNFSNYV